MMLRQYLAIMRYEVSSLWRDADLRRILLWGPIVGFCLFLAVYSAQVITAIPTAVVDLDRSSTSRQLIDRIDNTENLKVVASAMSFDELESMIRAGQVIVGVVIPEKYGRDLSQGRQARILAIIDGSNMVYATNASSAILAVARTVGAQAAIGRLVAHGLQFDEARAAYQSANFREEPWFNPALNYAYFLVLALALNVWQQCCTLAACMTAAGETSKPSWLQIRASGLSRLRLFVGKSIIQVAIFIMTVLPIYLLGFMVFRIPLQCGFPAMLLFTVLFAVALHGVGALMSSFARNPVDASRFGMIVALPSFVFSGYTWPLQAMPHWLRSLAAILPQFWFFQGLNYLTFKNPGWSLISRYCLALLVIAVVCYGAAALIISRGDHGFRRALS